MINTSDMYQFSLQYKNHTNSITQTLEYFGFLTSKNIFLKVTD